MANTIKAMAAMALLIGAPFCQAVTNYCVAPVNTGYYPPFTNWAMVTCRRLLK